MTTETKNESKSPRNKKILKTLYWGFGGLLALILLILIFINSIAEGVIRNVIPDIIGAPVTLEAIHFSPLQGRVEITNLIVSNPENSGYASPHVLKLGQVNADIEVFSLFRPKLVIEELTLQHIDVNFETNLLTSNLGDIINNLRKSLPEEDKAAASTAKTSSQKKNITGSAGNINRKKPASENTSPQKAAPQKAAPQKETPQKELRLQVNRFVMEDVGLYLYAKGDKKMSGVGIPLSMDPLENVGSDPEGVSPISFTVRVLTNILISATQNSGSALGRMGNNTADALISTGAALLGNLLSNDENSAENGADDASGTQK